jgi:hypothetical protein
MSTWNLPNINKFLCDNLFDLILIKNHSSITITISISINITLEMFFVLTLKWIMNLFVTIVIYKLWKFFKEQNFVDFIMKSTNSKGKCLDLRLPSDLPKHNEIYFHSWKQRFQMFLWVEKLLKLSMEQYPTHHTHSSCQRTTQHKLAIGARSKEE